VKLRINGQERVLPEGSTVAVLLEQLGMAKDRVAIEHNGAIVPKADYDRALLADGDTLEIVQFVGGG
jgi:thiamine biosynthesis protein ThiS